MKATHFLHRAAGSPAYPATHEGTCRICGDDGQGIPFDSWVRDTFTNHDQLLPGAIICNICQFAFAQDSTLLQERAGKDKPQRMQNYSHIVLHGEWHPLHKGQKSELVALLRQSPELAAIAVSGQKHIVFRARPGWWQVEEQRLPPNLPALDACLELIHPLYAVFSKDEIATGQYSQGRMMQFGLAEFLRLETALKQWRGNAYFDLALYLAQKEDRNGLDGVSTGISRGAETADPVVAGSEHGVQTEVRTQHLGTVREQHSRGGLHEQDEQVLQPTLFSL